MIKGQTTAHVRHLQDSVYVLDISGEVSGFSEPVLMEAYTQATSAGAQTLILNFAEMTYMNSSGIGLLVTLLVRANRQQQRLIAVGLNVHYQQIFMMTRLSESFHIMADEAQALQGI